MSTTQPHVPGEHGEPQAKSTGTGRGPAYYARRVVKTLASLQLTVGLLATAIGLVFIGTIAQIDHGIWTVVDKYFWSWTVDVPFEMFRKFLNVFWKESFPVSDPAWGGSFPFPAGKLIGALMLINLLAAHATRFKLTWKRTGVFLIHGGLILLFCGEFVTREFAIEQQMRIDQDASTDFTIDTRNVELSFVGGADPAFDRVATISQKRLKTAKPGERIAHAGLPADVEVVKFMKNSDLIDVAPFELEKGGSTVNTAFVASEKGTTPAAYVRLYDKATKQSLGAFAVSPLVKEQSFVAGPIALRLSMSDAGVKVVDGSPRGFDRVALIPPGRLKSANAGERITHPDLSLEVEVVQFMPRAELVEVAPFGKGKFTGNMVLVEAGEESGVAMKQRGDATAAYVRLYKKGTDEVIGVHIVGMYPLLQNQPITVDGAPQLLSLRNARYQKPYRFHLDKFSFDRYEGTEKPKNFSSDVRVYDEDGTLVRQQRIRMNEPLRYAGETFYQADWDKETERTTVLQVVKNPGLVNFGLFYATIDYIACAVVTTGLLLHFGIFLVRFLLRTARATAAVPAPVLPPGARAEVPLTRIVPWIVLGLMVVYLLSSFMRMSPPREPYNLEAFSRMPVHEGGRVKPLDTVARVNLRIITGKEEFKDGAGKTQPAIRWYLELLAASGGQRRGVMSSYAFIRIDNEAILNELGLKPVDGLRYSIEEIAPKFDKIEAAYRASDKKVKNGGKLDTTEMKYKELHDRLTTVQDLAEFGGALLLPPQNGQSWHSAREFRLEAEVKAATAAILLAQKRLDEGDKSRTLSPEDELQLLQLVTGADLSKQKIDPQKREALLDEVVKQIKADPNKTAQDIREALTKRKAGPLPILLATRRALQDQVELASVLLTPEQRREVETLTKKTRDDELAKRPANATWEKIITTYRDAARAEAVVRDITSGKKNKDELEAATATFKASAAAFNVAVAEYNSTDVANVSLSDRARARVELMFNRFQPFYHCTGLYVIGLVLGLIGFCMSAAEKPHWAAALRRSSTLVLTLTFVVHFASLFARMYVMDRPLVFVTNLYSSAIFIGCGCVALCLILERLFPLGIGNMVAATLGFATCIVAHNLATEDTLEMMQAVLDTNFWLATHVTTVTLGYTATFVAGFLGAVYVLMMLGTVVRDSYESKGEPTVGALLAFGWAVLGLVVIPVFFLWFAKAAMEKFEVVHSVLLDGAFWLGVAGAAMYGVTLMILRVSATGVDAHGQPLQGRVPVLARPVAELALTPENSKVLGQMVYGVLAFATLLSFVGTVLGGIWADQSWGRFWGWDPKENGAVLIVLWNAMILHARWCGLVKDRGVAVLAVVGNVITAWSWVGTNQLGIGLHAYGFDSRLADGCFNFWLLQFLILGFGAAIPRHFWPSASRRAATVTAAPGLPVAQIVTPPAGAKPFVPAPTDTTSPNGAATNGHVNGSANDSGHPHRDKGKKSKRKT